MVKRKRYKINYQNGTYFAVPLRSGGFGIGVVARHDRKDGIFGYFFGPRLQSPDEADINSLRPQRAVWLCHFGDLGLVESEWPILGLVPNWEPKEWPFPPLVRVDTDANRAWVAEYDENTFDCLQDYEIDPKLAHKCVEDGVEGYVAVEIVLTRLLNPTPAASA